MKTLSQELQHGVVGQVLLFALERGLARQFAHELEILLPDRVARVKRGDGGEVERVILNVRLREAVRLLVALQGLGRELAGTTVHLAGTKELSIKEDLQLQDRLDRLRGFGQDGGSRLPGRWHHLSGTLSGEGEGEKENGDFAVFHR